MDSKPLQCPVCNHKFDGALAGSERQFQVHVNQCVDGMWPASSNTSRSSSLQHITPAHVENPVDTDVVPAQLLTPMAAAHSPAQAVALLIEIMPDLNPQQALELLVSYNYELGLLVPMLLELRQEPPTPTEAPAPYRRHVDRDPRDDHHRSQFSSGSGSSMTNSALPRVALNMPVARVIAAETSLVELVIYDLQPGRSLAKNLGLGAFHSAVVVYGAEFSFGGSLDPKANKYALGVWTTRNMYHVVSSIKHRLLMGETAFTKDEVVEMTNEWGRTAWKVGDYHMLSKNCNHFTDMFLRKLGEKGTKLALLPPEPLCPPGGRAPPPIPLAFPEDYEKRSTVSDMFKLPPWVNRVAKIGDKMLPEFIFNKILEKMMPPVGDDDDEDDSPGNSGTGSKQPSPLVQASAPAAFPRPKNSNNAAICSPLPPSVEQPEEMPVVNCIAEVIGADAASASERLRILAALRRCHGAADVAVQQLLQ